MQWDLVLYVDVFVWYENKETGAFHLPYAFILTILCQGFNIFMINIGHSWVFKKYTVMVLVKKKYFVNICSFKSLEGPEEVARA